MQIVICTTGFNIGGMEVLFSGLIKYCLAKDYHVYFITKKIDNDIYHTLLDFNDPKFHLVYRGNKDVVWMNDKESKSERDNVIKELKGLDFDNSVVLVGFYTDLVYSMNLFYENPIRIMMIWPHPLDWINRLYLFPDKYHNRTKRSGSHFLFQRKLLKELDKNNASYYTSYAIRNYNEWYYNEILENRVIEGLPIQQDCGTPFIYHRKERFDKFSVLWVGRFTYFKNDAIEYIFKNLCNIAEKYPNIEFVFNIVGKGEKKQENDIKHRVNQEKSDKVKVNYLGTVMPNNLTSVLSQNDIGVAMGVTVKQMGYAGLPAVLIDSLSDNYREDNCCCWISETETGDDGDGMYYKLSGNPLTNRRNLYDIFDEVVNNPQKLYKMSAICKEHIIKHYMYTRQNEIILQRAFSSSFRNEYHMKYRHNIFLRSLWKIRKWLLNSKKKIMG